MTLEETIAHLFRMDETTRRRHSNPWSVFSRLSMIPSLGLAIWSRVWLGWWSVIPILAVFLWVWFNPRLFPEPESTNNWASKIVLGEWVWMRRKQVPVPDHHRFVPNALSGVGALAMILFIWGLACLELWPTILGGVVAFISKLWFADRMVWIYEDMREATPEYKNWLY